MATLFKDTGKAVYVWEAPVRVWHWTMTLALVVLVVTGFLIGAPPRTVTGEASENFLFGRIRFAHFAAGYIFTLLLVYRIAWAFMGNRYAREIFVVPFAVFTAAYWRGVFGVMRHYLFVGPDQHYVGHNPLAMTAMFVMYVLGSLFMVVTGFSLYGEGLGQESWAFRWFTSWVNPLFGQSQGVHTWHHLGMWLLIWFAMAHMYMAVREDLTSGLTIIGSMLNGWRRRK